jgi:hypothetical protein
MLDGNYGDEAMEALRRIDPADHVERLVAVALRPKAEALARERAMEKLAEMRDAAAARRLLPLLDETAALPGRYNNRTWRVCDQAALTISALLGWNSEVGKFSEVDERDRLIGRIRQWAGGAESRSAGGG